MADKTLTVNGQPFTFNRDRFAGVRTMTVNGETVTVDRTAPVIDSDRAGASRPLLSNLVGGAAAAYSLRDLNDKAGNNKVVRVRRESDNNERDFLAKEVSNGTLQNWVNSQATLPLDLQTLTSEGRTGSVIGAQAAYSLRNLSKNYTGNVVEVRRSSDDTIKSFKADSITNGDLVSFISETQVGWNLQPTFEIATGGGSISSQSSTATTATVTATGGTDNLLRVATKPLSIKIENGDSVTFNITASGIDNSGNQARFRLRTAGTNTTVAAVDLNDGTNQDITLSPTGSAGYIAITGLNTASSLSITFNSITVTAKSGFVRTWYDQSGNDNHATQGTAANQPKVVSNGSLIKDNDKVGIDFDDSSENFLVASSVSGMEEKLSIFSASVRDSSGYVVSVSNSSNGSKYFAIQEGNSESHIVPRNTSFGGNASPSVSGSTRLTFALTTGDTSTSGGTLGGTLTNTTVDYGSTFGSGDLNQISIGVLRTVSASSAHYFEGRIREIIVYAGSANGDQTDNRTALEANIAEHYGISGVPTAADTVNGFVEAWYDQSGNGKDAVQATATKQPKIVESGSLVKDSSGTPAIDWDNVDDNMNLTSDLIATGAYSIFAYHEMLPSTMILKGNLNAPAFRFQTGTKYRVSSYFPVVNADFTVSSSTKLVSVIKDSSHNGRLYADGTESSSGQLSIGAGGGAVANFNMLGASASDGAGDGKLIELIFYESDQTLNRPAIEANLANQYGITLS